MWASYTAFQPRFETYHLYGHLVAVWGGIVEGGEATVVGSKGRGSCEVSEEVGHTADESVWLRVLYVWVYTDTVYEQVMSVRGTYVCSKYVYTVEYTCGHAIDSTLQTVPVTHSSVLANEL